MASASATESVTAAHRGQRPLERFEVARALREIALLLELSGGNSYKARAHESGAHALEGSGEDLARLVAEQCQRARQRGIRFTIGADAHSVAGIKNLRWGVAMARRGGLTARDVLNTLGAPAFRAAVKP